ncbi:MAG: DivIVA domain-containing protein [Clostridia bacterium]|nr:DivIVA domain-containing protein [Clostridia bacterium]
MKGADCVLPPYELQSKKFAKAIKGYSMTEVDEHLAFV